MSYVKKADVLDDKTPYNIYYPVNSTKLPPITSETIPPEGIQSTSIDIGTKNFAIRIEKRFSDKRIETVLFKRIDFSNYDNVSKSGGTTRIDPLLVKEVQNYIMSIMDIVKYSRLVGIERQLAVNYKATRIYQHILTIFLCNTDKFIYDDTIIFDIDPKLKSKELKCPKGYNQNFTKKWAIEKAIEICEYRKDYNSMEIIKKEKAKTKTKGDDLSDTLIQMEAWFIFNKGMRTSC